MKTKAVLILCISLIFVGCNYSSKPRISFGGTFADENVFDTVNLQMQPCQLDAPPLAPWSCCLLDSLLIVGENFNKMKRNFFKVYNQNILVSEFGEIGNGPNDFNTPFLTSKGKTEQHFFHIVDGSKYCKIAFDTVNRMPIIHNMPMPEEFFSVNNVLLYNDSVVVVAQTGDFQLQRYDVKSQSVVGYNYFDEAGILSHVQNFNLSMQLFKSVCSSNNQYAVVAYHYLKMIDIISLSDMTLHKRICFCNYDCNDYEIVNKGNFIFDDNVINFFTYVTAGEDRFYALCWDCTSEDASSGSVLSRIYEIDYNGIIRKQYRTNVSITSFAVKEKEIYAIVLDHEKHEKIICKGTLN